MKSPTPEQLRTLRLDAGLTQLEVSRLLHLSITGYTHCEQTNDKHPDGLRKMSPATWELMQIKLVPLIESKG